jgi:uncharacterized protein
MRVLVSGGTGFVGKPLTSELLQRGHEVYVVTRDEHATSGTVPDSVHILSWSADQKDAELRLPEATDGVINLAGESIASGRWTEQRKARIRSSRIQVTSALVEAIRASSPRPSVLVNASAVGYYGPRGDEPLSEDATPGRGFLTDVVLEWEQAARAAEPLGVRVALMRLGVVLGRTGGALPQMTMPFRLFAGGRVASGKQWLSWVHIDDVVGLIVWALENPSVSGPINTVAPEPLTNADLSTEIGRALRRPSWLPAPAFALKLLLGEMAEALLINGQRVLPTRALELGYVFRFPTARAALEQALR